MSTLPQFQDDDRTFQLMQNAWAGILNPIIRKVESIGTFLHAVQPTAQTLTSGVILNLTSIQVPAGIWLVGGAVSFPSLPANATRTGVTISTSSTTRTGDFFDGSTTFSTNVPNNGTISSGIGPVFAVLSKTTPYYLNVYSDFSAAAVTANGTIYAVQLGVF